MCGRSDPSPPTCRVRTEKPALQRSIAPQGRTQLLKRGPQLWGLRDPSHGHRHLGPEQLRQVQRPHPHNTVTQGERTVWGQTADMARVPLFNWVPYGTPTERQHPRQTAQGHTAVTQYAAAPRTWHPSPSILQGPHRFVYTVTKTLSPKCSHSSWGRPPRNRTARLDGTKHSSRGSSVLLSPTAEATPHTDVETAERPYCRNASATWGTCTS